MSNINLPKVSVAVVLQSTPYLDIYQQLRHIYHITEE